ncbi:glycoside hydrolase family 108 protein [Paracoccus sulfuroxidans]|uniref:Lysozyme family protein n=1 Tax=Paracoccus sulfuroxidans TaxID=384678 RepID=A0A562NKI2_9RHOB|nr:glycosyl hydrolase 108 family protein [Paracoccus sulfuroxidans]TWI32727.1 lysozyme family protein [Paracoccus sulfuroxidans]
MKDNFDACMTQVFLHEGGYADDPADPGGETNFGISKRSYPEENIKGMTRARAAQIYRRDFWDAVSGDSLPAGLDLLAFDPAVNSGVSRGAKWLQQALGVPDDGKIGPKTIAAARAAHPVAVIDRACDLRLAFLRTLKTWPRYGKGWTARVESIREVATAMAASKPAAPVTTPTTSPAAPGFIGIALAIAAAAAFFLTR